MSLQENTLQAIDNSGVGAGIPGGYTAVVRTVGKNIARIRKARGVSQVELAERLEIKQPSMWKFEHGKGLPELETLFRVAKALPCTIDELIEGIDPDYDAIRGRIEPVVVMKRSKTSLTGAYADEFSKLWDRLSIEARSGLLHGAQAMLRVKQKSRPGKG